MDDNQEIGEILEQAPVEQSSDNGTPRDDKGRFAPKANEPESAPEPAGEKLEVAPPPVAAPTSPPDGYVPLAALVDQRLEARQAKQRLQELERQLREAQTPKQPAFDPDELYSNPENAIRKAMQAELEAIRREQQTDRTALFEERLYRVAGGDKAAKIEQEIGKALEAGDPEIQILAHTLQTQGLSAVNALVQWYDKRTFDPSAERERLKSELLAELQAEGKAPQAQPSVMPSNLAAARNVGTRSGPNWSGPPALDQILKGSIFK